MSGSWVAASPGHKTTEDRARFFLDRGTADSSTRSSDFEELLGVAVNWIFSSRIKFVGLEVILGVMTVVGGSGLFLTFWRSLGGPPGEQDVLKKHVCDQNLREK